MISVLTYSMERREVLFVYNTEYWFLDDNGERSRLRLNLGTEAPKDQLSDLFASRPRKVEFVDEVTFCDPDGNHIGFTQFVPKGWRLVYIHTDDPDAMLVEFNKKWILVPQVNSAKEILGLLHEIGHAWLFANMTPEQFTDQDINM